jgi:hypothetical protein
MILTASATDKLASQARPGLFEALIAVGILVVLAAALGVLLTVLLRALRTEPPRFESYWGGLGRGLGGWSVNTSLVLSVLTLMAFVAFLAVAVQVVRPPVPEKSTEKSAEKSAEKGEKSGDKTGEAAKGKDKESAPGALPAR